MRPSSRSLTLSERNRQNIIDYLLKHPGCLQTDAIKALGLHPSVGGTRFLGLKNTGEIRRDPVVIMVPHSTPGVMRKQRSYKCYSLVEKTRSAEDVAASVTKNLGIHAQENNQAAYTPNQRGDTNGEYVDGVCSRTAVDRPVTACPDAMHSSSSGVRGRVAIEGNW